MKYTHIVSAILIFLLVFDAYFAFVYHQIVSPPIAASMLETNTREAKGMLLEALPIALILILAVIFLYCMSLRELRKSSIPRWFSLTFIGVVFFVALPVFLFVEQHKAKKRSKFVNNSGVINYIGNFASNTLILGSITTFLEYKAEVEVMRTYGKLKRILPVGITLNEADNTTLPEKIFVIVGESSSRNHYSLFGYNRPTTPFLDSLSAVGGSSFAYRMAISGASITRDAVPMALSFAPPFRCAASSVC